MADEAARGKGLFRTLQVLVNYLFIIIIINYIRWQMKQHEARFVPYFAGISFIIIIINSRSVCDDLFFYLSIY